MKRGIFCSALAVLALLALPARAAIDPFYLNLLRDGQHALDRKDFREAARDFRLACFGMLDEPRMLTDCLARLALAQDAAGDVEGFRDTFQRLVELEDRFKAYSQADLAPELRAALEARLASRLPAATLEGAPAFRSTLGKKGAPPPAAPVVKPPAAAPAKAPEKLPQKTPEKAPEKTPEKATTAPPPSPQPASPKPLTDAERQKLERARSALTQHGAPKDVLRDAFQAAREVADAHPDSREAQHLAAEAAYRISRWPDAATYFRRGGDPGDGEPERLFYQAVSLFESGDPAGAAASLRRALPGLKRTPYVESYMKKILGGAP